MTMPAAPAATDNTAREQANFEITFHPNPIQKAFIESKAEADLFATRFGEGKSAGLVWGCWYHTMHNPGAKWAFIRDTWENLRETTQVEFFDWFPPGIMGHYKASEKKFSWTAERIGLHGDVTFMGLDDPSDAAKLQSRTFAGFAMDEVAPAAESGGVSEMIFDVAMGRLRQKDMKWYAAKLAENNPDENHWTYRRFVDPGDPEFALHHTLEPENIAHLPDDYYGKLFRRWSHRPDLQKRFIEGKFGYSQIGQQVTPEWSDDLHLAANLKPVLKVPLHLLWDGGLNPTCIITQVTPLGYWNILEAYVGEDEGMEELITDVIKPLITSKYDRFELHHIGDPTLRSREQSSSKNSAEKVIRRMLGGRFRPGPDRWDERIQPLKAVMRRARVIQGQAHGVMQVDRDHAKAVWHALRGGWHRRVATTGIIGEVAKDKHSHPGDCMGYGAAELFPLKAATKRGRKSDPSKPARYFGNSRPERSRTGKLGFEKPGLRLPREMRHL